MPSSDHDRSGWERRWVTGRGTQTGRRLVPDAAAAGAVFTLLLVLVAAGWDPLLALDDAIVDGANQLVANSDGAVRVLGLLTDLGGAQVAWVVLPLTVLWLALRGAPRAAALVAVAGIGIAVLDPGIKALVGRARPLVETTVAGAPGFSFPSGHALGSTVTYGVLLLVFLPAVPDRWRRRVVAAAVGIVVVVGTTRVLLGVHHPSDVLAGWALGVLVLALADLVVWPSPRREEAPAEQPELVPAPRSDGAPIGAAGVARLVGAAVVLWGLLIGAGELVSEPSGVVLNFDANVVAFLAEHRTAWLSDIARLVGTLGGTAGIVVGLLVAAVLALALTGRWRDPLFLVVAVAGETAIFVATASIVQRGRPAVDVLSATLPPTTSFPSGHVAAATALYGAVAVLVVAWRRGWLGGLAGLAAGLVTVGVALSRLYRGVHYPTDVIASVLFTAAWIAVCWWVIRPSRPDEDAREAVDMAPALQALRYAGAALGALLVVALVYGMAIEPRYRLDVREQQVALPGLPADHPGTTVAVFSDIQVGMWWDNSGMVARVVDETVAAEPDAVLLPGDFVYGSSSSVAQQVDKVMRVLAPLLDTDIPVYAVMGNHDWKVGAVPELTAALEERGVEVMQNTATTIPGSGGIHVVGIGAHRFDHDRPEEAFAEVPDAAPRLVMMHNPATYPAIPARAAPFSVAGHTHCGQIAIPGTPAWSYLELRGEERVVADGLAPPEYGAEGNQLFVTCGVGMSLLPMRIFAPPQLLLLDLVPAE